MLYLVKHGVHQHWRSLIGLHREIEQAKKEAESHAENQASGHRYLIIERNSEKIHEIGKIINDKLQWEQF
jgi:hypothetical protein